MDENSKVILHKYSNCTIAMEILCMESTCDDRPVLQSLHCMVLNILLQYIVVMPYFIYRAQLQGAAIGGHLPPMSFTSQMYAADAVARQQSGAQVLPSQPQIGIQQTSTQPVIPQQTTTQPAVPGAVGGATAQQ